jgi:hypothetical protein
MPRSRHHVTSSPMPPGGPVALRVECVEPADDFAPARSGRGFRRTTAPRVQGRPMAGASARSVAASLRAEDVTGPHGREPTASGAPRPGSEGSPWPRNSGAGACSLEGPIITTPSSSPDRGPARRGHRSRGLQGEVDVRTDDTVLRAADVGAVSDETIDKTGLKPCIPRSSCLQRE